GLPAGLLRVRRGQGLRAAGGDPDPHRDPAVGGQEDGVLLLMSGLTLDRAAEPILPPLEDEPERRRFLFSPWHLVLLPAAFLMLVPLLWMLVTSVETLNETRHFPPILVPRSIRVGNYAQVLREAPFTRWFLNTLLVTVAVVLGNLVFC